MQSQQRGDRAIQRRRVEGCYPISSSYGLLSTISAKNKKINSRCEDNETRLQSRRNMDGKTMENEPVKKNENKQEFVGSVRVKPVAQEVLKTCAAGMIAVSSGILFFWIQNGKALTTYDYLMLSLHALAIPLLVSARVLYAVFDHYERISTKSNEYLETLLSSGVTLALVGYVFTIFMFSKFLAAVFIVGCLLALYQAILLNKEIDGPHMKVRD